MIHLKLRESVDADVPSLFASALGVFGKDVEGLYSFFIFYYILKKN